MDLSKPQSEIAISEQPTAAMLEDENNAPPGDSGPDSSSDDSAANDESYQQWFKALSNEWLHSQLTHNVSLAASNSFWELAFKYLPKLMELKEEERISKKIPQFLQVNGLIILGKFRFFFK